MNDDTRQRDAMTATEKGSGLFQDEHVDDLLPIHISNTGVVERDWLEAAKTTSTSLLTDGNNT